jgi:uncharacterized coiled-coil protein SlyX
MNFAKRMDRAKEAFGRSMAQLEEALAELKRSQEKENRQLRALAQRAQAALESIRRTESAAAPRDLQDETNRSETRHP